MHQVEAQCLRHRDDFMSGLQPSLVSADTYLGLRPRLVCRQAFGLQNRRIMLAYSNHEFVRECHSPHIMPVRFCEYIMPVHLTRQIVQMHQAPKARQHYSLGRRPGTAYITPTLSINQITPALLIDRIMPTQPIDHIMPPQSRHGVAPMHQAPKARQHYSLGRRPRSGMLQNPGGLKARHISRHNFQWAQLQPCRTTHQKEPGL
jgi:hypothetical protein